MLFTAGKPNPALFPFAKATFETDDGQKFEFKGAVMKEALQYQNSLVSFRNLTTFFMADGVSGFVKGGGKGTPKRSVFSTNAHSRFVSVVLDPILGPQCLSQLGPKHEHEECRSCGPRPKKSCSASYRSKAKRRSRPESP